MPLDIIGHIYADWISSSRALPSIVNLVHPQPTSWDVIVKGVMDGLGEPLPVVPLNEWMREVDALSADAMIHELGNIVRINLPSIQLNTDPLKACFTADGCVFVFH